MNVDYIAARQAIADLKSHPASDTELIDKVLIIMSRLSAPGAVKRKKFSLKLFLAAIAEIDFSNYKTFQVAMLFKVIGESLDDGLMVADHGFTE